MEGISVGVDIKHVNSQVVGSQVHRFKDLGQVHGLLSVPTDGDGSVSFQSFLDEPEQMFLIHAGGCMDMCVHLSK